MSATCSNGEWIDRTATCVPPPTCADGTAAVGGVCFKTCPDGSRIAEGNACPEPTKTCWDGTVIPVYYVCPDQTKTCPGGQVIPVSQVCPELTQTCWNGAVIPLSQVCPPQNQTCPDGTVIPVTATCYTPPPTKTCWDGTVIPAAATCAIEGGGTENCAEIDLPRSEQARYFNACYSDGLYFNENVLKRENPGKSCFKFYSQRSGEDYKYYHNGISYHPESCVTLRVFIAPPSYGDYGTGNIYSFDFVDGPTDGIRAVLLQQRNEYDGDHVPYRSLGFSRIPGGYADYETFCHDGFYYSQGMNRNCSGGN